MSRIELEFPEASVFCQQIKLRVSDINYGQHLGHDTLISLLHEARCCWLASAGLSEISLDGEQVGWVVAELAVNYKSEAFYPEQLSIELAVGDVGRKGVEVYHRVLRSSGETVAIAKTGLVFFDFKTHQATEVPEQFKKLAGIN